MLRNVRGSNCGSNENFGLINNMLWHTTIFIQIYIRALLLIHYKPTVVQPSHDLWIVCAPPITLSRWNVESVDPNHIISYVSYHIWVWCLLMLKAILIGLPIHYWTISHLSILALFLWGCLFPSLNLLENYTCYSNSRPFSVD